MGSEHSSGSSGEPEKPEGHQAKTEGNLGEQPAGTATSDTGNETVEAHSDEGSASQTVPQQQQEENSISLPAEELGLQDQQKDSQEVGQPPSLSQSASSDKGHPTPGQTSEMDIALLPFEHSSEEAKPTTLQSPPEAGGEPKAEPGAILLTSEGPSVDPESQREAENHPLAESSAQKSPDKMSPCPTERERGPEGTVCDDDSFEVIAEDHPEPAASEAVEGHPDATPALQAQGSAGADLTTTETAPHTQVGQDHSAVDAQTAGGEGETASKIPEASGSESPLAQPAVDTLEKPPVVEHADTNAGKKFTDGIQKDGRPLPTEAAGLGKERPATVFICDAKAEPLSDPLAGLPLPDLDEAEERSLMKEMSEDEAEELSFLKEMVETCSGLDAIELAEAKVRMLSECPRTVHVTCTEVTLAPVPQETLPVATADSNAQPQGSSGAQKESTEGPAHAHAQKHEARFPKTLYLCCSQCSDGETNAEQ